MGTTPKTPADTFECHLIDFDYFGMLNSHKNPLELSLDLIKRVQLPIFD